MNGSRHKGIIIIIVSHKKVKVAGEWQVNFLTVALISSALPLQPATNSSSPEGEQLIWLTALCPGWDLNPWPHWDVKPGVGHICHVSQPNIEDDVYKTTHSWVNFSIKCHCECILQLVRTALATKKSNKVQTKLTCQISKAKHEMPTNCGTKAGDVLANFFSQQTLTRINPLILWWSCNYKDFTTPINSVLLHLL